MPCSLTGLQYIQIGDGVKIYQGPTDPALSYTIFPSDVWIDTTTLQIVIRHPDNTWKLSYYNNLHITENTISTINPDGGIVFSPNGTGVLSIAGVSNYDTRVLNDNDIPNKKYIDSFLKNRTFSTNLIYVSENGNDLTGNGNLFSPYRTIGAALLNISSNDQYNRYVIIVAPGEYDENSLTLKPYVYLKSIGGSKVTRLTALSFSTPLINVTTTGMYVIEGFELNNCSTLFNQVALAKTFLIDVEFNKFINACVVTDGSVNVENYYISDSNGGHSVFSITNASLHASNFYYNSDQLLRNIFEIDTNAVVIATNHDIDTPLLLKLCTADSNSFFSLTDSNIKNIESGVHLTNGSTFTASNVSFSNFNDTQISSDLTSIITITSGEFDLDKFDTPVGYDKLKFLAKDKDDFRLIDQLSIGTQKYNSSLYVGDGAATKNYISYSSDSTNSIFVQNNTNISFYTATVGESIYIMCKGGKHYGLEIEQLIGLYGGDVVFQYYDGSSWINFNTFSTSIGNGYKYADSALRRSSSKEKIYYGIENGNIWEEYDILGNVGYWIRILLTDTPSQNIEISSIKCALSSVEITNGGVKYSGNTRKQSAVYITTNQNGESAGISDGFVNLSTWTQHFKSSRFTLINDYITVQFPIPDGIDTSMPIKIKLYYTPQGIASAVFGSASLHLTPIKTVGNIVANDNDIIPVSRLATVDNTVSFITPQINTQMLNLSYDNHVNTVEFDGFDISAYYSGDIIAMRLIFDDDSIDHKDFILWNMQFIFYKIEEA